MAFFEDSKFYNLLFKKGHYNLIASIQKLTSSYRYAVIYMPKIGLFYALIH